MGRPLARWKLCKKLRCRKGMTLIEIMVGFSIMAVLMVLSMSVMLFSVNVLNTDGNRDRLKMAGDQIYSHVSRTLTFATRVEVLSNGGEPERTAREQASYDHVFFVKDGRLYGGPKEGPYQRVFSENVYQDTKLTLRAEKSSAAVLSLEAALQRDTGSKPAYQTASSLRLVNLAAGTEPVEIECTLASLYENPVISYEGGAYKIEEGYDPDVYHGDIFTVACYPSFYKNIKPLVLGEKYQVGDLVVDKDGTMWRLTWNELIYNGADNRPGNVGHQWTNVSTADWSAANRDYPWIYSVYKKYDVVTYGGAEQYYMAIHDVVEYPPSTRVVWKRVYWFQEKATDSAPWLGWSDTEDTYKSACPDWESVRG